METAGLPIPPPLTFRCGHCGSATYSSIPVLLGQDGSVRGGERLLHECDGCSLIFSDPMRWTHPTPVQPPAVVQDLQNLPRV